MHLHPAGLTSAATLLASPPSEGRKKFPLEEPRRVAVAAEPLQGLVALSGLATVDQVP